MVASVVETLDAVLAAVLAAVFVLDAVWVVFLGVVIGVGLGVVVDVVVVTSHKLDVNKFENIITVQFLKSFLFCAFHHQTLWEIEQLPLQEMFIVVSFVLSLSLPILQFSDPPSLMH